MGHLGNPGHADVCAMIDDAIVRIVQAGKAAGILHANPAQARHYLALGATFVAVGVDASLLARATEKLAQDFKARHPPRRSITGRTDALGVSGRSEEHTSELQSLMRISYAVLCLNKKKKYNNNTP